MRGLHIVVASAVLVILVSGCVPRPAATTQVDALYVQRLNSRLAQYNQTTSGLDADLKQRFAVPAPQGVQEINSGSSEPPDAAALSNEISRDAEYHARANTLTRFMREAAASGQFGAMSSWLQTQTLELVNASKETDGNVATFQTQAQTDPQDPQLPSHFITLIIQRGTERGAAEELMAISNDVQGYEQDYKGAAAADEQRRERATRLLAAYLSAPRVTVQAPPSMPAVPMVPMPRMTTCMQNGMFTNCMTQ